MKDEKKVLAALINYYFKPVNFRFSDLTSGEKKAFGSKENFDRLIEKYRKG